MESPSPLPPFECLSVPSTIPIETIALIAVMAAEECDTYRRRRNFPDTYEVALFLPTSLLDAARVPESYASELFRAMTGAVVVWYLPENDRQPIEKRFYIADPAQPIIIDNMGMIVGHPA